MRKANNSRNGRVKPVMVEAKPKSKKKSSVLMLYTTMDGNSILSDHNNTQIMWRIKIHIKMPACPTNYLDQHILKTDLQKLIGWLFDLRWLRGTVD